MKTLKLDLTKTAAIDAAINTAEGKATTRTADSSTATALANFAETELTNLGLPKEYWKGAQATYLPGAVCGSNGYRAFGTWLELTYGSEGWFLTGCDRREVGSGHNGGYDRRNLVLSLEQQRQVLRSNPTLGGLLYELLKLKADLHHWRNLAFSNATEAAAPMKRNNYLLLLQKLKGEAERISRYAAVSIFWNKYHDWCGNVVDWKSGEPEVLVFVEGKFTPGMAIKALSIALKGYSKKPSFNNQACEPKTNA